MRWRPPGPDFDWSEASNAWFAGYITGLIVAAALALTASCASLGARTIPIAVVAWPAPIKPTCTIANLPELPQIVGWVTGDRIYVTKSDLAGVVQFNADVIQWAGTVAACLDKLSGVP